MGQYIDNKEIEQFAQKAANSEESGIGAHFIKISGKIREEREGKEFTKGHGDYCYSGMKQSGGPFGIIKKIEKYNIGSKTNNCI